MNKILLEEIDAEVTQIFLPSIEGENNYETK